MLSSCCRLCRLPQCLPPRHFSSRPPCRSPTGRSTSATSWSTSRPTSGCASSACRATRCISSAPTTRTARRSCSRPRPKASRRRSWSRASPPGGRSTCKAFTSSFDHWHSTHSPENFELSQDIYRKLKAAGLIYVKPVEQFFDPVKKMFLPDRYIKGECPNCHTKDQYGDACENLQLRLRADRPDQSVLDAVRRRRRCARPPITTSSGSPIRVRRVPEELARYAGAAAAVGREQGARVADAARATRSSATGTSRAMRPTSAFRFPDAPGKYFYVWLDAPIGYLASLKNYFDSGKARAQRRAAQLRGIPRRAGDVEQIHFIGKDIIYFHTLFWPAMLQVRRPQGARPRVRARLHHACPARRCRSRAAPASARCAISSSA